MKKGISFFFGFESEPTERAKLIKQNGFDCVITSTDPRFDYENFCLKDQNKLFKNNNLELSSLHSKYDSKELKYFWTNSKKGDELEASLIEDVMAAKQYGYKCVVVHLSGNPNKIGYDRLKRVLKVCEEVDVPLAIENIDDQNCFLRTFENIKSDYMLFCYDSGHNHAFDPEYDYLTNFIDKLVCLHLHDNMGSNIDKDILKKLNVKTKDKDFDSNKDFHTLNKYGSINWKEIAKKLAKAPRDIVLDYEILMRVHNNEKQEEVLKIVYKQACELENMIEKYKQTKI